MKVILSLMCVILLMLFSIPVLASEQYNETGNFDNFFQLGAGTFNQNAVETTNLKSISIQRNTPLVSDLDGDGINEIIVLDDATLKLYQTAALNLVIGLSLNVSGETVSNLITYDIDGDGFQEVIFVGEGNGNENIFIAEYNGTVFQVQNTIGYEALPHESGGETLIKCRAAEDCLMAFANRASYTSVAGTMSVFYFNSTGRGSPVLLETGATPSAMCMPKIRTAATQDYDNDGDVEYIFSYAEIKNVGGRIDEVFISYIDVSGTVPSEEQQIIITDSQAIDDPTSTSCVTGNYGKFFSSPMVDELTIAETNLETVIGVHTEDDNFIMQIYRAAGTKIDNHPDFFTADGTLISNVMKGEVFSDGNKQDFCVMGYDPNQDELTLLCGSEVASTDDREFRASVSGIFNITETATTYNTITHSSQQSNIAGTGELAANPDEFINAYGTFLLDDTTFNGSIFVKSLNRIWTNPVGDSVIIGADVEKVGSIDLLALTSTSLYYIDDGFSNSPANLSTYTINPCLDSSWQQNTTVSVKLTCFDTNADSVGSRVTLYKDNPNEQVSNSSLLGVDTNNKREFQHTFTANATVGTGELELVCYDSENQAIEDDVSLSFTVTTTGLEFGDCETTVDLEAAAAATETGQVNASLLELQDDNIGIGLVSFFNNIFGLGAFLGWLLIMIIVALVLFISPVVMGYNMTGNFPILIGFIAIVEAFILMVGVGIGAIGIGGLITILVIAIVGIAIGISRWFQGSPG